MRTFFFTSCFALLLFAGATSFAPAAHAQYALPGDDSGINSETGTSDPTPDTTAAENPQPNGGVTDPVSAGTPATKSEVTKTQEGFGLVMMNIMTLFAWLVGVAALMLDNAVYFTVVKMGDFVHNLSAIGVTWRVLRDIGNIVLIFGFLAIGISTILKTEKLGYGSKALPMLLVAAVFLNFSLFITEAVIDTGNLFATQFYTQINGGNPAGAKSFDSGLSVRLTNEGISNKLMNQLGLQTIYGDVSNTPKATEILKAGNSWVIGFMAILLFLITAFVMFALAFILIARFVILIFLIILAPIGFVGLAIPKLKSTADKWWGALFQQTITAPVLLLLLYIALAVITDAQFLTGLCVPAADSANSTCTANAFGWATGNFQGFASFILSFLVAMGLLLAVIILSKKMSAFGGDWATKTAGKLSFGATAWAGRNSVGWAANKSAKYLRTTRIARIPLAGTGLVKGLEGVAGRSFDARGVKAFGGLKGLKMGELGDAQKGGYTKELEESVKSRTEYAGKLRGRDFKDLTTAEKFRLAERERALEVHKKALENATTAQQRLSVSGQIKEAEDKLDEAHKEIGTERGNKLKYAGTLSKLVLSSNTEAGKKIKEEARKSKDDKELDALRKALKKAGGEDGGAGAGGGGVPAGAAAAPAAAAGGGGGGAPPAAT